LRPLELLRAVVFLRLVVFRLLERDPVDLEDEFLPDDDFALELRVEPVLDPDLDDPFEPLRDWTRRFEASKTTDPAPPMALDMRYAIVPPAANFPRDLALPTPEATSWRTPSTRFCPGDFGDTAFLNNFARLVGINHAFSPPSARLIIALRLFITAT
jgi:hypothetical protein